MTPKNIKKLGWFFLCLGFGLSTLAWYGLWKDYEWIAQPFYAYVWWGYIFILDGFCALTRGKSLFTTRYNLITPIVIWSTTFWFVFELFNIRFQNWYYVGIVPAYSFFDLFTGVVFMVLSFGTVFTGIFQTIETLTVVGLWRKAVPNHPYQFPNWFSYAIQALGLIMVITALAFPYYLAPLIWGSFGFIVDPSNYRAGARSILRDIEVRDWGMLGRILVAGLICGLIWESLNYLAPQKWIYTVRGLEEFKLFEMPLLGFLGFPGLALDAIAGYALFARMFLGNKSWEDEEDLSYKLSNKKPPNINLFYLSIPIQFCFWLFVGYYSMQTNIGSIQLSMSDLSLERIEILALNDLGYSRPRQIVRNAHDKQKKETIKNKLGWSEAKFRKISEKIELYTFKGIGSYYGRILERSGISKVGDLSKWNPSDLHKNLQKESEIFPKYVSPRLDMVKVWVLAAKDQ